MLYAAAAWELTLHDRTLLAAPIGHDLTFTKGFLGTMGTYGVAVMLDSTDLARICATIQGERVTAVVWVPTMAARLVNFDYLTEYNLKSLKKMHCDSGDTMRNSWDPA